MPIPGSMNVHTRNRSGRIQWWWKRDKLRELHDYKLKENVMMTVRHCWKTSAEFVYFRHAWMSWASYMEMTYRQKKGQTVEKVTSGLDLRVIHVQVKPSEKPCSPR